MDLPDSGMVGVGISGGLDSLVLLFYICDIISPNVSILPMQSIGSRVTNTASITKNILSDARIKHPNLDIKEIEVFHWEEDGINEQHEVHGIFDKKMYEKYKDLKIIITGLTALPSWDIVNSWGDMYKDEKRVNKTNAIYQIHHATGAKTYRPFAHMDKRDIALLFKQLNLPERYIKESWSCTYYAERTNNYTEPCKICYHCHEKKWAFGQY